MMRSWGVSARTLDTPAQRWCTRPPGRGIADMNPVGEGHIRCGASLRCRKTRVLSPRSAAKQRRLRGALLGHCLHNWVPQSCQHSGDGDGPARCGPGRAVPFDKELAGAAEAELRELDSEGLAPGIILDRILQVTSH